MISILTLFSCSADTSGPGDTSQQNLPAKDEANISYGNNPQQKFDLYLPAGRSEKTTKVFLYIHGGGWIGGDKSEINGGINLMKQTYFPKYAIVSINYVLAQLGSTNYAFPNQINDIQAVINHIKSKSSEYQVKPEFVLCGNSAGGHLSMLYAYTKNNPDIKAVVNIVGPADFNDPVFASNPYSVLFSGLVNPAVIPAGMDAGTYASPVTWISESSVPTISFHGTSDATVPLTQKDLLEAKLTLKNVPHQTYIYNGNHTGWMYEPHLSWLLGKMKDFLETHNP